MRLLKQLLSSLEALAQAIDARDPQRQGHTRRVQAYALELGRQLKLPAAEMQALRIAALLHDVGQLVIPDHLLAKPGRLSESEFQKVRAHPAAGAAFLAPAGLPKPLLAIIRHHHEHWDGSGYPDGLKGSDIPQGARILAVADAFESMTSDRPYRGRMTPPEAAALIEAWAGLQFDPEVVQALRRHHDSVVGAPEQEAEAGRRPPVEAPTPDIMMDPGGFGASLHRAIGPDAADPARAAGDSPTLRQHAVPLPAGGVVDAQAAQREVYALYEIARTLGTSLRLTEVLDLVVSKIGQLVPFRTCAVYLAAPGSIGLEARFVSGAHAAALRGRRLRQGEGITGWAAEHRSSRFSGCADLELAGTNIDPSGYSTVAAFPLSHREELPGVITLLFPAAAPCTDDHVRLMEIVARLASGAIGSGRLAPGAGDSPLADSLTHLPNRRYLEEVFEQETIRCQQSGQPLALLAMDLDDLKAINDRFGPPVGDQFLLEAGRVLKSHLREGDVLVRLQEDEFAALLPGSGFAAAALLAGRLQQAVDRLALRLKESAGTARAGLSIGVAIYPLDGESLDDLMTRATLNQIQNKRARKSAQNQAPNVVRFPGPVAG